jgi:hypothetical protein
MDYYEPLPCVHTQGATVEGAFTVLTAKPFKDYKNFAIGALIQNTSAIIFPNDDAIKTAFAGRTRCPFAFYEGFTNLTETCPALNTDVLPPAPRCWPWTGPVCPAMPSSTCPLTGRTSRTWRRILWTTPCPVACTAICPFVPAFCALKGISCDSRRLQEEKSAPIPKANGRVLSHDETRALSAVVSCEESKNAVPVCLRSCLQSRLLRYNRVNDYPPDF